MIYLDENKSIYTIFNINTFNELNNAINNIAPSIFEYHINTLVQNLPINNILNKSNIQDILNTDLYNIYLDYNNEIFIEYNKSQEDHQTESLW